VIQQKSPLSVGTIIRDVQNAAYIVEGILGQGGFSSVYLVRDQLNGERLFTLKELITPKSQEKFKQTFEAEVLMRLHHPSLPHIYEVFEDTSCNRTYLLMDYIEGKDLETLREKQANKRYPLVLVIVLMNPIVEAISYLHSQTPPIVHRDIKPSNIIVPTKSCDAFLVDFGLAKEYVKNKTTNIVRYGTPGYAAPEQYGQGTSLQTDVYGLAATIYTLLTGTVPPDAITRSFNKHAGDLLKRADQLNPAIPSAIGKALNRALSLQPEKRYASVDKFWKEFTMAAEVYAISGNENKNSISQAAISPLPLMERQTTPFFTLPVTPFPLQPATVSSEVLEPPVRQLSRPALLFILSILILLVLSIVVGSFFWLIAGSRYTSPVTPIRHHTSVVPTDTCVYEYERIPDTAHSQVAPCFSSTGPTPSPTKTRSTSYASSFASRSTSPRVTPTLVAANPTPSLTRRPSSKATATHSTATPTPSTTRRSSSTATATPSTATPTPTPADSPTATPTSSANNSIISTDNPASTGINVQVP
jgi:serine/threonine protein kinase